MEKRLKGKQQEAKRLVGWLLRGDNDLEQDGSTGGGESL